MRKLARSFVQHSIARSHRAIGVVVVAWRHQGGQDMIEYALMAAAIAVAVAAIFPQSLAPNISTIFSKVNSSLGASSSTGT